MNKNNTPYRIYSITLLNALHNYHIITFNLHRGLAGQRKPKQETEVLPSGGDRYRCLGSWGDWDLWGRVLDRKTKKKRGFRNRQRDSLGSLPEYRFANTCRWLGEAWRRRVPQGLRAGSGSQGHTVLGHVRFQPFRETWCHENPGNSVATSKGHVFGIRIIFWSEGNPRRILTKCKTMSQPHQDDPGVT